MAAPASDAPRIRVAAIIELDGAVVLVRHRRGERTYHLLPGGGVARGETLAEALVREVAEETGLAIEVGRPAILSDTIDPSADRHVVNIAFLCRVTGGAVTHAPADPRVEAVDLVPPAELAGLDLRPPVAAEIAAALSPAEPAAVYLGARFAPETEP